MKILNVKPFQETLRKEYCGPASLKIVLDYYGIKKSEKELARLCKVNKDLGTSAEKILSAARKMGLKTAVKNNSTFSDIERWINKNVPVIVNWFTRGRRNYSDSDIADGHYSVVVGLDSKFIYLQDPEIGKIRKLTRDDFQKVWFDFSGRYINEKNLIIRQIMAIRK